MKKLFIKTWLSILTVMALMTDAVLSIPLTGSFCPGVFADTSDPYEGVIFEEDSSEETYGEPSEEPLKEPSEEPLQEPLEEPLEASSEEPFEVVYEESPEEEFVFSDGSFTDEGDEFFSDADTSEIYEEGVEEGEEGLLIGEPDGDAGEMTESAYAENFEEIVAETDSDEETGELSQNAFYSDYGIDDAGDDDREEIEATGETEEGEEEAEEESGEEITVTAGEESGGTGDIFESAAASTDPDQDLTAEKGSLYVSREEAEELIPDDFDVPEAVQAVSAGKKKSGSAGRLPSSFDSRRYGMVTPVKDQGDSEICWAYSSVACAESSAIVKNLDEQPDYSERHLAYFFASPVYQDIGICGNDSTYYINSADDFMNAGGNNRYVTFSMANWTGVAGQYEYPDNDSWIVPGISASSAIDDRVHLKNAAWIRMTDVDYIKKKIMNLGCVASAYYYKKGAYYNPDTCAYYNDSFTATNHAINLIGWDDAYPKENFLQSPERDGAWLVRNSWGTEFGENGYFWLSYCDLAVSSVSNTAFAFDFGSADEYDNIYFYDGSCGTRTRSVSNGGSFANVFTVCGNSNCQDELIRAVGVGFSEAGVSYEISIYTDLKDRNDPASGVPALSGVCGVTETAGYQLIELREPVKAVCGSSFSVVVRLQGSGDTVTMFADMSYENGNWIGFYNETDYGQSFVGNGAGGWTDLHEEGCSMRIKAFTDNLPTMTVKELSITGGDQSRTRLKKGMNEQNDVSLVLQCGTVISASPEWIEWSSSDPSVLSVTENGEITGVHVGDADVTACLVSDLFTPCSDLLNSDSSGNGNTVLSAKAAFTVYGDISECKIALPASAFAYKGESICPEVRVLEEGVDLIKGRDYTLAYSNNINSGHADVTITGIGYYIGKASANYKINKAVQTVAVQVPSSVVPVDRTMKISLTGVKEKANIRFQSSNTAVLSVNAATGEIKKKKVGAASVTVSVAESKNFKALSKTVKIKVVPSATASVTAVNCADGIKLSWKKTAGANGYIIYRNNKKIKTIPGGSTVTYKDAAANVSGKQYQYKIVATAATGRSPLSKSGVTWRMLCPANLSVKNHLPGKIKVKWKKNGKASGYRVQISRNIAFTSGNKWATLKGADQTHKVFSGLKKGRIYYIRVRSFKTSGGKRYWSAWSAKKVIKIRS